MPAKSASPEAAQRKVWKAELRAHQKAAAKVIKDFNAEERRLKAEAGKAYRSFKVLETKLNKFQRARYGKEQRAVRSIEERIAILSGRLGI